MKDPIYLNDLLQLDDLKNVKLRFNLHFADKKVPAIKYYNDEEIGVMLYGQYHNYSKKGNFKEGNISLGFVPIPNQKDSWLLFHIGRVVKDLNQKNGLGYEYEAIPELEKYEGRVIIHFENKSQNLIRCADTTIKDCTVKEVLPEKYNTYHFPGYDNVNISWKELSHLIKTPNWETALRNQKGVYLLTDKGTGKKYVGSAYGENMIYARWDCYIKTCHGNNNKLTKLSADYIKNNFYFSILETFNSNVSDDVIIARENYWKEVLDTRKHGYNDN